MNRLVLVISVDGSPEDSFCHNGGHFKCYENTAIGGGRQSSVVCDTYFSLMQQLFVTFRW